MQWSGYKVKTQKEGDKNQVFREVQAGLWGDALKCFPPMISK